MDYDLVDKTQDIAPLTLDKFKMWSAMALKSFLSLRTKNTSGSTETLAAR